MRYLLVNHPIAICVVLFAAIMLAIRYAIAPYIVNNFGLAGVAVWIGAFVLIAIWMEKRGY